MRCIALTARVTENKTQFSTYIARPPVSRRHGASALRSQECLLPQPAQHAMLEALLGAYASPIVTASILCAFPSLVMLGMSFLAIGLQVPDMFTAALQHLAAGIVLSAVAVELVPKILEAPDDAGTTLGMTVGFFFGISLFLLILPALCGEPEEEEEEDGSTRYVSAVASGQARQTGGSMKRRPSLIASMKEPPPHYPWPLVFAVGTDALVDGLLIGISGAGGIGAGIIISAALTVEMGFLGLTFAASLKKQPAVRRESPRVHRVPR